MSQVLSLSRREPLSDFKGIAKTLSEQSRQCAERIL